jgi:hypothetical protein
MDTEDNAPFTDLNFAIGTNSDKELNRRFDHHPIIRRERVLRGLQLVQDPNYPDYETSLKIARSLVRFFIETK